MPESFYRARAITAVGYDRVHGDAVILSEVGEDHELQWAFPSDDIPELMLLLNQTYANHIAVGETAKQGAISVENAQFLTGSDAASIRLTLLLGAGVPVHLNVPLGVAAALRDELNATFG